ncbi:uncharacterized protein K452DRAFT_337481 [Aplosporella prunicola CBS 121167]|uniref:Uncharacterized protein n=1 Tax=Aplosporella prunicola CBS 121167 TaxID=1176127 RepID=A0A6A6B7T8_9PEZI|nr:uncharacterized protein K452DRAFT_337481 [Aplosporella prunicola CBS 121167]KAF2139325.1 hypothetical protein K452DRAFT_337481 [Aplosporella prunicola CBS 121167]
MAWSTRQQTVRGGFAWRGMASCTAVGGESEAEQAFQAHTVSFSGVHKEFTRRCGRRRKPYAVVVIGPRANRASLIRPVRGADRPVCSDFNVGDPKPSPAVSLYMWHNERWAMCRPYTYITIALSPISFDCGQTVSTVQSHHLRNTARGKDAHALFNMIAYIDLAGPVQPCYLHRRTSTTTLTTKTPGPPACGRPFAIQRIFRKRDIMKLKAQPSRTARISTCATTSLCTWTPTTPARLSCRAVSGDSESQQQAT